MPSTLTQARDEILDRVRVLVASIDAAVRPEVAWPDVQPSFSRAPGTSWVEPVIRHATSEQSTLAAQPGSRVWTQTGTLLVFVYTPSGNGMKKSDIISQVIQNGFRGFATASGVWFKKPTVVETGASGAWQQSIFSVEFEYYQRM